MHRSQSIDNAKGIGIALVVLGHNWITGSSKGELYNIIFSFHMPLFIFLSGIYLNQQNSLKETATKKATSLLKPYLSISLILILAKVPDAIRAESTHEIADKLRSALWANGDIITWPPMWYLPHIFLATLISSIAVKYYPKKVSWRYVALLVAVIWIGGTLLHPVDVAKAREGLGFESLIASGLPWGIDLLPITAPIMIFGYACRNKIKNTEINIANFLSVLVSFSLLHLFYDDTIDLNRRQLGSFFIVIIEAGAGVYLTLAIAKIATKNAIFTKALCTIGKNSLFILIFHTPIQSKSFSIFTSLGMSPYMAGTLSFASGIAGPLLVAKIVSKTTFISNLLLPKKTHS